MEAREEIYSTRALFIYQLCHVYIKAIVVWSLSYIMRLLEGWFHENFQSTRGLEMGPYPSLTRVPWFPTLTVLTPTMKASLAWWSSSSSSSPDPASLSRASLAGR